MVKTVSTKLLSHLYQVSRILSYCHCASDLLLEQPPVPSIKSKAIVQLCTESERASRAFQVPGSSPIKADTEIRFMNSIFWIGLKSPKILHIIGLKQQLREIEERKFKYSNFNEVGSLLPSEDNVLAINNLTSESHSLAHNMQQTKCPTCSVIQFGIEQILRYIRSIKPIT